MEQGISHWSQETSQAQGAQNRVKLRGQPWRCHADRKGKIDKGSQCGMWKKGRVLKLLKGKDDGIVRGVALETIVNGSKRRLERAVQEIYPLEISIDQETKGAEDAKEQELRKGAEDAKEQELCRSSRMAAKNAKALSAHWQKTSSIN